jgi:hypothetical protein
MTKRPNPAAASLKALRTLQDARVPRAERLRAFATLLAMPDGFWCRPNLRSAGGESLKAFLLRVVDTVMAHAAANGIRIATTRTAACEQALVSIFERAHTIGGPPRRWLIRTVIDVVLGHEPRDHDEDDSGA